METDEELSPSKLYARYKDNSGQDDSVDHESLLLNLFSLLSTLEDVASCFNPKSLDQDDRNNGDQDFDLVFWFFNGISNNRPSSIDETIGGIENNREGSLLREWSIALQYIHGLIPHIAPLELHIIASQALLFSDGSNTSYRILCLLLCTSSLQKCPLSLQKRWKRWQSLTCETLRIFQDFVPLLLDSSDYNDDSSRIILSLLIHHIVPTCLHVIDQLPSAENSYHVAIFSALLGTSCNILERKMVRCQEQLSKGTKDATSVGFDFEESRSTIYDTILSIRLSFERFGVFSEMTLWIDSMLQPSNDEENRNKYVNFLMHRDSLSWWARHRSKYNPEGRIANIDTSVNEVGLALLAMKAFQERPIVYHPNFVWKVWLPYVIVLFRMSGDCPSMLEQPTSHFLESLVLIVPQKSLVVEKVIHGNPDGPIELFLSLSNRLISRVQTNHAVEVTTKEEEPATRTSLIDVESEFKLRSQRTVGLIKALLSRFTTVCQVQIVKKLLQDCSTPGLQSRFLDLLRPVILIADHEAEKLLWELLVSIINDLFKKYWDRKEQNVVDLDVLINRDVEISVGAITMIQMWSMVEGKEIPANGKEIGDDLRGFHAAVKKLLNRWSENASLAPKLHYRLFLLDNAIENILQFLM